MIAGTLTMSDVLLNISVPFFEFMLHIGTWEISGTLVYVVQRTPTSDSVEKGNDEKSNKGRQTATGHCTSATSDARPATERLARDTHFSQPQLRL